MPPERPHDNRGTMSIILVRHGATDLNRARVLQPPDTPLSSEGIAQATAVASELARLRPAAIVTSDYARAVRTAETVAHACGLPLTQSDLLRERNFGSLRGQAYDQLGFDPLAMLTAPPGGESATDFTSRVERAFAELQRRRALLDGPLVAITHGLVIRAMLAGPAGLHPTRLAALQLDNTSVTILAAKAPHDVELLASTRHLDAGLRGASDALRGG